MSINKTKIKSFQKKLSSLIHLEVQTRKDMKHLYDQFILDADDDKIARRYVLNAYYAIQKKRLDQMISDKLEFHPFFGANTISEEDFGEEDIDDGIL